MNLLGTTYGLGEASAVSAAALQLGLTVSVSYPAGRKGYTAMNKQVAIHQVGDSVTVVVAAPELDAAKTMGLAQHLLRLAGTGVRVVGAGGGDPLDLLFAGAAPRATGRSARGKSIRDTMARKALQGIVLGRVPYGYRSGVNGAMEEDPEESQVVRHIFRLAFAGQGVRAIVADLNASELRTRRGGSWSMITVRDMLRNRVYTGTYHRFGARVSRNHPALVSMDDFAAIQARMDSMAQRSGYAKGRPFLLSGLAKCGACGGSMIGATRRQSWARKDGAVADNTYRYYQCEARTNQGACAYHTRRAAELEIAVLDRVGKKNLDTDLAGAVAAGYASLAKDGMDGTKPLVALRKAATETAVAEALIRDALVRLWGDADGSGRAVEVITDDGVATVLLRNALRRRIARVVVADGPAIEVVPLEPA